jgi:GNAT superfamily N-acetyltransferase
MLSYQTETLFGVVHDIQDLIKLHYDEIALHKDRIPLAPDWDRYRALEDAGQLVVFTVRDGELLVGYSVFFLSWHLHYKTTRMAMNDVLFLHKDYRKGTTGIKLIKHSEQELREMDVDKVIWHVKFNNDFRPILNRLGYCDEEAIVAKML